MLDKLQIRLHKLLNWEYWPMWTLYIPVVPLWLYHAVRNRSFYSFTATNPGMKNGGMYNVGKMSIYKLLPPGSYPRTILVSGQSFDTVLNELEEKGYIFPLIVKPDMGMRGILVKKLDNMEQLQKYHEQISIDYLIQEYIDYPCEAGIFYVRMPGAAKGIITGITTKKMMSVTGDGKSSIRQLMQTNPRYAMQIQRLESTMNLDSVPANGDKKLLQPIGNHNLGTLFADGKVHIGPELEASIDQLCSNIPGFYYGRLDIRFRQWDELKAGKNFSVIELNGCLSEPTQMYDPAHGYLNALKEIHRHHHLMFRIAAQNLQKGIKTCRFKDDFREMITHFRYASKIQKLAKRLQIH